MKSVFEMRGLRYPDEYVIKMFFKEGLSRQPGSVLEFGCGTGNNLSLFSAFGWKITGVDISEAALDDARYNLEGVGTFVECDLATEIPVFGPGAFDAVLLPSVNNYLPRDSFVRLLQACRTWIRPGGMFYIRSRRPEDWRWGRGKEEGPSAFRLDCRETGEFGLLNVFYSEDELSRLIHDSLGELRQPQQLRLSCDNPQGGIVVRNEDLVIWGRVAER